MQGRYEEEVCMQVTPFEDGLRLQIKPAAESPFHSPSEVLKNSSQLSPSADKLNSDVSSHEASTSMNLGIGMTSFMDRSLSFTSTSGFLARNESSISWKSNNDMQLDVPSSISSNMSPFPRQGVFETTNFATSSFPSDSMNNFFGEMNAVMRPPSEGNSLTSCHFQPDTNLLWRANSLGQNMDFGGTLEMTRSISQLHQPPTVLDLQPGNHSSSNVFEPFPALQRGTSLTLADIKRGVVSPSQLISVNAKDSNERLQQMCGRASVHLLSSIPIPPVSQEHPNIFRIPTSPNTGRPLLLAKISQMDAVGVGDVAPMDVSTSDTGNCTIGTSMCVDDVSSTSTNTNKNINMNTDTHNSNTSDTITIGHSGAPAFSVRERAASLPNVLSMYPHPGVIHFESGVNQSQEAATKQCHGRGRRTRAKSLSYNNGNNATSSSTFKRYRLTLSACLEQLQTLTCPSVSNASQCDILTHTVFKLESLKAEIHELEKNIKRKTTNSNTSHGHSPISAAITATTSNSHAHTHTHFRSASFPTSTAAQKTYFSNSASTSNGMATAASVDVEKLNHKRAFEARAIALHGLLFSKSETPRFVLSKELRFLDGNEAFFTEYGIDRKRCHSLTIADIVPVDRLSSAIDSVEQVFEDGYLELSNFAVMIFGVAQLRDFVVWASFDTDTDTGTSGNCNQQPVCVQVMQVATPRPALPYQR